MCLKVTSELKVAEKDILVYKILYCRSDGRYESEFYKFPYRPNKLYVLNEPLTPVDKEEGGFRYELKKGFHAWKNIPHDVSGRLRVVKFIIPKGAAYYEGIQHDQEAGYVSDQIKMIGELNWFEKLIHCSFISSYLKS